MGKIRRDGIFTKQLEFFILNRSSAFMLWATRDQTKNELQFEVLNRQHFKASRWSLSLCFFGQSLTGVVGAVGDGVADAVWGTQELDSSPKIEFVTEFRDLNVTMSTHPKTTVTCPLNNGGWKTILSF